MNKELQRQGILSDLNLEPIIIKAMDGEEGHGWDFDFAKRVSEEYRKFLILCLESDDEAVVPSSFVDDFWHLHILDTQKYLEDCDRYLGYLLHHFPYFGMRGEKDAENLRMSWEATLSLYESVFGDPAPADLWPKSTRCPNCGRRRVGEGGVFDESRPKLSDMGLSL